MYKERKRTEEKVSQLMVNSHIHVTTHSQHRGLFHWHRPKGLFMVQ